MKDKTTPKDAPFEQWLQQSLAGDKPSPALQEKLRRIPEQFPSAVNIVGHKLAGESGWENRWLYPLLATAASVVGILAGLLDLLAVMPKQDFLTALLYGTPNLSVLAL
ncbi:hypothetical protein [Thiofilum flexile]|uniref:hypothetical protein n=1 Tax=Thiofilum flexile TaxID=125627 RepID=UPI00036ED226|nr:hypothetical protein [Thiofilum flexile]